MKQHWKVLPKVQVGVFGARERRSLEKDTAHERVVHTTPWKHFWTALEDAISILMGQLKARGAFRKEGRSNAPSTSAYASGI